MSIRMKRIYLASPYTHEDRDEMCIRYQSITDITAKLVRVGYHIFSPITHNHPINRSLIEKFKVDPGGFDYWMTFDISMISEWADEVWVIPFDGWKKSKGVAAEIDVALSQGKKVVINSLILEPDCTIEMLGDNSINENWK